MEIESSFGILKRTFPCLRKKFVVKLETTFHIIVACTVLYNLRKTWNLSIPDDSSDDSDNEINMPQVVFQQNQRGQGYRSLLIRKFQ